LPTCNPYRQRNLQNGRLAQGSHLCLIPEVSNTEDYRVGMSIIRQGDLDRAFYVLEKGAVEVIKDGVVLNTLVYPGTIFGEVSAILGEPRTSTVKARTQTTVTKYESVDLRNLVCEYPDMAAKTLETLANRLKYTTQKLMDSL